MAPVIAVDNLGKKYRLNRQRGEGEYLTLRDSLAEGMATLGRRLLGRPSAAARREEREFWALRDVCFEVQQGETVGIIGRNGAGKSTLLKILSRITQPSTGAVRLRGRVVSLLEVGTGFHPELTGRENIYLNGAILGMSRAEIRSKFDEIVAFAEVEKFLDTPVKRYSSGMYVRLAFAVAAHLEPEILVVDEVLAVGDAQFQKKCLRKMGEVAEGGRTVLFVSHNLAAVRQLCNRGLLLDGGRLMQSGPVAECIASYVGTREHGSTIVDRISKCVEGVSVDAILVNGSAADRLELEPDSRVITMEVAGRVAQPRRLELEARISDLHDVPLAIFSPGHQRGATEILPAGAFSLSRSFQLPDMTKGNYYLSLYLTDPGRAGAVDLPRAVIVSVPGTAAATGFVFDYDNGTGWVILPEVHR
jgi:lipopolysaccharide transport system ATP-binding protein